MGDAKPRLSWTTLAGWTDRFDELLDALPVDERARAERFRVESARRRFVLARTLLRRELAIVAGVDPALIEIAVGDRGKPYLAGPETGAPARFNLSHSGEFVALVVADVEVGVDVESLRTVPNAERLAVRFFSPAEQRAVLSLDGGERDQAFLRIWTRKEAYLKATGLGVAMPLRGVETEPAADASPRLIAIGGDAGEASRWRLRDVEIPGAVCTVASLGAVSNLEVRRVRRVDLDAT